MKFAVSQLSALLMRGRARQNMRILRTYALLLTAIVLLYSLLFHILMELEGQHHSMATGLYWTLTVMSTLGFGDITFQSDIGRLFSMFVLLSGIMLLLIMLPFTFIQFFYAPWLEAQARAQAPRRLPDNMTGHVVICKQDSVTPNLIRKLQLRDIPYVVIEPDPQNAAHLVTSGMRLILGELDSSETYQRLKLDKARLVIANASDPVNTNVLLTVRSVNAEVPTIAIAEEDASLDIFSLSGATHPLPLKRLLGEQLAARVGVGIGATHEVGRFKDLIIVEFLVHDTPLDGKTLREAGLREKAGVNVIGVWESGHLLPIRPDLALSEKMVAVAIGSEAQIARLNKVLQTAQAKSEEVLIIGGGKVGISAAATLRARGVRVRMLDRNPALQHSLKACADEVVIGDASDLATLEKAGIHTVRAVALTTNDDAQNIHLAVYCRRLHPELNIISRITRERNLEAIYRAGADFVLSYASLGCEYILSYLVGRQPIMVGEGADIFSQKVPDKLVGKRLAEAAIGASYGLVVIAIEQNGSTLTNPGPDSVLNRDGRMLMLGTPAQWESFKASLAK